jgi:hypothetical protein
MKSKKIGIITILKVNNYGAELQAYATQRAFQLNGGDAEIIDYLYYKNCGHKRERWSYPVFKYPMKFRVREWVMKLRDKYMAIRYPEASQEREGNYTHFQSYMRFSRLYHSYSELYNGIVNYDVYCVGSDQVWNPGNYTNLDPYFLTFAPEGKVRMSYASSFGVHKIPECATTYYRERLNHLDFISVREQTGAELVKSLINRDIPVVLDPTLLLERSEWEKVARPVESIHGNYLLIYELHKNTYLRNLAQKIAKDLNLQIVRICSSVAPIDKGKGIIQITTAGPSEFIWMFLNAKFIITNSFHGTAFALNFGKAFYTVTSRKRQNNSRQEGLLSLCGLSSRLLYDDEAMPQPEQYPITFNTSHQLLAEKRRQSVDYIRSIIDGTKKTSSSM